MKIAVDEELKVPKQLLGIQQHPYSRHSLGSEPALHGLDEHSVLLTYLREEGSQPVDEVIIGVVAEEVVRYHTRLVGRERLEDE
jgi:hypothetical protein